MNDEKLFLADAKTEEVQHIIERMPTRFGFWVSSIVLLLSTLMFAFGWLVRYPDVVNGVISINADSAPIKLIANTNGKLRLTSTKSMDYVKEGMVIAYVENPTNPTSVIYIDSLLKSYNPNIDDVVDIRTKLPHSFSLGELNTKYYGFASALQEYTNYKQDKLFDKQSANLNALLNEQKKAINTISKRVEMAKNSLRYAHKFYTRDSTLFTKKVISESELDKTEMNFLSTKDALQSVVNNLINAKQTKQQTEGKIQE
jgi:hypothetical protein